MESEPSPMNHLLDETYSCHLIFTGWVDIEGELSGLGSCPSRSSHVDRSTRRDRDGATSSSQLTHQRRKPLKYGQASSL